MKKSKLFCAVGMMTAFGMILPFAVHADDAPVYIRPSDRIVLDEEGRAFCPDGTERKTGRFALEPDFLMGDANNDAQIDADDAAIILEAAAYAGSYGMTAEEFLCSSDVFSDADTARIFSDADQDGIVDSSDAAIILQYCAEQGAAETSHMLGYSEYLADEEGFLQKGFIQNEGKTYYADDAYRLCSGWLDLDGTHYYLNQEGVLQSEIWIWDNGHFYYVQSDGSVLCDAWQEQDGNIYYLGSDGASVTGMTEIDGAFYYFTSEGMVTGWVDFQEGSYYFSENGILQTGWLTIGEETFWLGEDGKRQEGLLSVAGNTYFFYPESGCMAKGFTDTGGKIRYFDENGIMLTGWFTVGELTHYSLADGTSCTGLQTIDGNVYYFASDKRQMVVNAWVKQADGWRYFNENGISLKGWQDIDGATYYLDENGIRQSGWLTIDGVQYYFSEDGSVSKGWTSIDGNTYYFGNDGIFVTGWQDIDSNRYYFDENGIMLTDQIIDGVQLGSDGKAMSALYYENKLKAQAALAQYGTSVDNIFSYVRATNRYKKTEATKTLEQIESLGWLYFVDYSMKNYYGVCYYLTAKMDFVLMEAGYTCRIVHATHGSGDHYWNQIYLNGTWVNYDCTNNLSNYTWNQMVAFGNYQFLGYVRPEYQ